MKYQKLYAPISLIFGIILIIGFILLNTQNTSNNLLVSWLTESILSIPQLLALIGLGFSLALLSAIFRLVSIVIFIIAYFLGLEFYEHLWFYFSSGSDHLTLTVSIINICSGILLVSSKGIRKYLAFVFFFIIGLMLSLTLKMTASTFYDSMTYGFGLVVFLWIIISLMLSTSSFYKEWFLIVFRIFGSWLIAGGLLYGGTSIAIKYKIITPNVEEISYQQKEELKIEELEEDDLLIPDFGGGKN